MVPLPRLRVEDSGAGRFQEAQAWTESWSSDAAPSKVYDSSKHHDEMMALSVIAEYNLINTDPNSSPLHSTLRQA